MDYDNTVGNEGTTVTQDSPETRCNGGPAAFRVAGTYNYQFVWRGFQRFNFSSCSCGTELAQTTSNLRSWPTADQGTPLYCSVAIRDWFFIAVVSSSTCN